METLPSPPILEAPPVGIMSGNEHSSPLKNTFEGYPSPEGTLIPGVFDLVNEITDCCLPGTLGSLAGFDPSTSPIK
ncbi:hypothetical protein IEQ34_000347 [Dendrobium chrysotoxum]|uniref:Uncharacterized protein n=1 Tax=Dendrobium chrysotoxum TaxID=161865 RepID=A0AAV7HA19_DENCH|nr:hypothetical protein IEQ34_000347 [Dendrobium chrysotoxum]